MKLKQKKIPLKIKLKYIGIVCLALIALFFVSYALKMFIIS